jgi:UPF0755 protein
MFERRNLWKTLLILFSILAASFSLYIWQILRTPNLQTDRDEDFYLYIPTKSATFEAVWDSLAKHRVVKDELSFKFLAKLLRYPDRVKPGRYRIKPNSGNLEVLRRLRSGDQTPVRLTFNNIRTKADLVHKVGTKFEFDSTQFAARLSSDSVTRFYGFTPETIMAMFLPNTYEVFWTTPVEKVFGRMKSEYDAFWTAERKAKAKAIGLTPVEVSILASIVEAETKKQDEKPRVAGLYLNRLTDGEPLQSDPTVIFALGNFGIKRLLYNQLRYDSPYNTYLNAGLPPGPINLPDLKSIDAVLNHEKHPYKYMCASPQLNGYHVFAVDYQEHLINARMYQAALNQLGIRK